MLPRVVAGTHLVRDHATALDPLSVHFDGLAERPARSPRIERRRGTTVHAPAASLLSRPSIPPPHVSCSTPFTDVHWALPGAPSPHLLRGARGLRRMAGARACRHSRPLAHAARPTPDDETCAMPMAPWTARLGASRVEVCDRRPLGPARFAA